MAIRLSGMISGMDTDSMVKELISSYDIKKQKEGFYTLFTFTAKPDFIAELDRVLRLDETVLKHMIVKLED